MPVLTRRRLRQHFAASDPVMAALIEAAGPFRLRPVDCPSPFEHLSRAIISQQISGSAAKAILRRFVALFDLDQAVNEFPRPDDVLRRSEAELRSAGISAGKIAALRDLAHKTLAGVVPNSATLQALDDTSIVDRLTVVRGIGAWTVQMMLMFQLGRPDVLPANDYGVRNGFRLAYRRRDLPTPSELQQYGERWAPYRSAAAWYLWRAVDLDKAGILWERPVQRIRTSRSALRGAGAMPRPRRGAQIR